MQDNETWLHGRFSAQWFRRDFVFQQEGRFFYRMLDNRVHYFEKTLDGNYCSLYGGEIYKVANATDSGSVIQGTNYDSAFSVSSFEKNKKTTLLSEYFSCYPNPVVFDILKISYTVSYSRNVKIEIFDQFGRKISTLLDMMHKPGEYSIEMNVSNFSSGLYMCKMTTDNAGSRYEKIFKY